MAKSSLAVDRMSDRALWTRAAGNLMELQSPWPLDGPGRSRQALASETLAILRELRMRGTQLRLGD